MGILHKHNPLLHSKLSKYIKTNDSDGLTAFVQSLSVSEFRTAGFMLAEDVLVQAEDEAFWNFFFTLVTTNAKAFLGTCLKAAVKKYKSQQLTLNFVEWQQFAVECTVIDRKKVMEAFLPCLRTYQEVRSFVKSMSKEEGEAKWAYPYLLKAQTLPCLYILFELLKIADGEQVNQCVVQLIKMNTPLAYNMANILKRYFGINHIPVTFSKHIEDYQLNRLDQGYESFKKLLVH